MPLKVTRFIWAAAAVLCCGTAAGCGSAGNGGASGGSNRSPATTPAANPAAVAARVCQRAGQAARPLLGDGAHVRIADKDPFNIECVVNGRGIVVDSIAQASSQAWVEWDTATVHQVQAYASGAVHVPSQIPRPVPGLPGNIAWIPAQNEIMATNGTQSRGGTYVTVTVTRHTSKGPSSLAVATVVTRAVLASAPRGQNPVPPS